MLASGKAYAPKNPPRVSPILILATIDYENNIMIVAA
jgi:hypothetical protein